MEDALQDVLLDPCVNVDLFWQVALQLSVDDVWVCCGVAVSWRQELSSEHFWKSYCASRGWDYRSGLAQEAMREAQEDAKAKQRGYRKRKSFCTVGGDKGPSVRMFARRCFLRRQKTLMFETANDMALDALRNVELRRQFGTNTKGFLDHVLALDPRFAPALNRRALLCFDSGSYAEAVPDLELAVKLFPYFSDAVNNLGLALHEVDQLERALRLYTRALALEGDAVTFNNRGLCYNDLGKNELAIQDFTTILTKLNPRYVDAFNNRAYSKNCLARFEEAIVDCGAALALNPDLAEPRRIRAYAFYRLGRFSEAVSEASHAMELFESFYAKAFYTRGLALKGLAETAATPREVAELLCRADEDMRLAVAASPNVANEL